MYFSKVSSLVSSLSLSFSLHFNLFPSGSTPLIERVCMAGTKRKKEIDNDTRQHCVENLDLSRTQSVSLSHTHTHRHRNTPHFLHPCSDSYLIIKTSCVLSYLAAPHTCLNQPYHVSMRILQAFTSHRDICASHTDAHILP